MRKYLLPECGKFFKANLHCHSTFSDGRYTPAEIKEIYKQRGYSVVAYSDHRRLTPHNELRDDSFLPLTAVEWDITRPDKNWITAPTYHLNFFSPDANRDAFFDFTHEYSVGCVNSLIKRAGEEGYLVMYNHPRWSLQSAGDFVPLEGLWAFEVFNTGCEIENINGYAEYEYDVISRAGKYLAAVADDDNHNARKDESSPYSDSFGGFTMIKAEKLDYDSIFNAMKKKELYASTGPLLNALWFEDGKVHIECSPCSAVSLLCDSRCTHVYRSFNEDITVMDIPVDFEIKYIRIECADRYGRKAMSRVYSSDELYEHENN